MLKKENILDKIELLFHSNVNNKMILIKYDDLINLLIY